MYFHRKVYAKLKEWKDRYAPSCSLLLEGARRVGKTTIAEHFARSEYRSYILIDFANTTDTIRACFDDISNPDIFFLRLQAATGVTLYVHESIIIFDEIQLFPKARQAVKYLVRDGRYHYLETGSLISIKKNVKDILIPSEERHISVFPMDYEEFLEATGIGNYDLLRELYRLGNPAGQQLNRKLMRDYRIYMAVGGMPQAVEAFVNGANFSEIDRIKRDIIRLYENDFKKIDSSGRISMLYHSIPAQLSRDIRRYSLPRATGRRKSTTDEEKLFDLIDSRTVLVSYNSAEPMVSLSGTRDLNSYKLYLSDTGLFVTLLFIDRPEAANEIYTSLLSDRLPANLGYLYENAAAQAFAAGGRELYYHTWNKEGSTHYYECDFLIAQGKRISPIEVKSSGTGKHESLTEFERKYAHASGTAYLLSQKDIWRKDGITGLPVYMASFL